MLDQQPGRLPSGAAAPPTAGANEHPAPFHALPVKDDLEIPFLEALAHRVLAFSLLGLVGAAIPEHHGAAAVLPLRDCALEGVVLEGMILHLHREPLHGGIRGRSLRYRPTLHHAVQLEPEIEMQAAGGVLLNHKIQLLHGLLLLRPAFRFRGLLEIAFATVLGQLFARAWLLRSCHLPSVGSNGYIVIAVTGLAHQSCGEWTRRIHIYESTRDRKSVV